MKRFVAVALFGLLLGPLMGKAQTADFFINNSPLVSPPDTAPQIDATAFINRSVFNVSSFGGILISPLPFETANTLFFTNTPSGVMSGNPGFRFNYAHQNVRDPMDSWVNQGFMSTDSSSFFFSGAAANWMLVEATNIVSSGLISVGSQGLMRFNGENINLTRAGLRSGNAPTNAGFFFGSSVLSSNYFNDVGITDLYWGTGTNNAMDDMGMPMQLDGFGGFDSLGYTLPFPESPFHEVIETFFSGFRFTNTVQVPSFGGFGNFYSANVLTNQLGPTNFVIQVVFTPTNAFDTNLVTDVTFHPESDGGATVVVGFKSVDFDIVSQVPLTNTVFLVDALAFRTNTYFANNFSEPTLRPYTFDVTRNEPFFSFFGGANNGNAVYDPLMIYNPATYASNRVEVRYAGYAVNVSSVNSPGFTVPGSALSDPTNFPGRIEVTGDRVNLDRTRLRADSTFILRTADLVSNKVAQVDAPFLVYDIGSTQPLLEISNMAPATVRRLSGPIYAYSATWRNFETNLTTTNAIDFHFLIVDHGLVGNQPVLMNELSLTATNCVIHDDITVGKSLAMNIPNLDIRGNISLPFGADWADTNIQNLVNLTNSGTISMTGSGRFGTEEIPYENLVNEGTLSGASHFLDVIDLDNPGCIGANGGLLSVKAHRARLLGAPTLVFTNTFTNIFFGFTNIFTNIVTNSFGAKLSGNSDIAIFADEMTVSNSIIASGLSTPGGLFFNVTNRLMDSGPDGPNNWSTTAGFNMARKPTDSDLLHTEIRSTVRQFSEGIHFWSADDFGASSEGYDNNIALGRLVLDGQGSLSQFNFTGTGPDRAIYVDYIFLENYATNFNETIQVAPNMTIYFAGANVPVEKLDGAANGGFRWVPSYAGPNTTTNIMYPSGNIQALNRFLVNSPDIDSDGDGIVNSEDPTPVFVPEQLDFTFVLTDTDPKRAQLSWNTIAYSTNKVQIKTSLDPDAEWLTVTSIVNGPVNTRIDFEETVPPDAERYYQIRIDDRR